MHYGALWQNIYVYVYVTLYYGKSIYIYIYIYICIMLHYGKIHMYMYALHCTMVKAQNVTDLCSNNITCDVHYHTCSTPTTASTKDAP